MNIEFIESSVELVGAPPTEQECYDILEKAGRVCWKSENDDREKQIRFLNNIIARGHESVLEHVSLTFKIITDRGVTHELVRHRIASYSQESTRYVNYCNSDVIQFILPGREINEKAMETLKKACEDSANHYQTMLEEGATPQEARAVLPNALKTEIYFTANIRELRHFLKLRMARGAHPDIRKVANEMQVILSNRYPVLFSKQALGFDNQ